MERPLTNQSAKNLQEGCWTLSGNLEWEFSGKRCAPNLKLQPCVCNVTIISEYCCFAFNQVMLTFEKCLFVFLQQVILELFGLVVLSVELFIVKF